MDTLKIKPSQERELAVKVDNSEAFAGFELKIFLPDGISFQGTTKAKRVKASDRLEGFNISGSNQADGSYKISVANLDGELIQPGEGALFSILLKADENATLGTGEIKLGTVRYSKDEVLYTIGDVSSNITIFDKFTITASSANSEMGSVTGGGDYESGTNATLTATANEGYHFVKWSNDVTDNPYTFEVTTNASLTATFAPNQYTMTFVLGNGEANVVKTQDYGSALTAPTGFERSGYSFTGWSPEVPTTIPLGNQTYTAQWSVVNYTISYNLAGGQLAESVTNPTSYNIESENITLANPTREGYTFAGWTGTELTEATQAVTIATGSTGNRSYTATWTINQYTMTFVLGNGEANVVKTQDYGSELTAPTGFERSGYSFTSWSPEVPATVPLGNQTYTAQWSVVNYTISYNLGGGQLAEGATNPTSYNIESENITLANPTREGYTFAGWTGTDITEATQAVTIATGSTGNRSYTATWTINQYTMTFVLGNGEANVVKTQDYGSELTAPIGFERSGYSFTGWSPEVPTTIPFGNQTYTAQWSVVNYTISYDLAGGQLAEGVTNPTSYNIESENITLANPTREGYTFGGWLEINNPVVMTVTIATGSIGNRSFIATWMPNSYTIAFEVIPGLMEFGPQPYGSPLTVPTVPERVGYTFTGWNPELPPTVPLGDQTYIAQWSVVNYTISYNLAGGQLAEGVTNPTSYNIESENITLANPTREGYTFAGWTGTELTEATQAVTIAKGSTGNRSYTATWIINQYAMTFVLDNGEANVVKTLDYGSALTAPTDVQKTGYTFMGWSPEVPTTVPSSNQTFTAQWQINQYTMTFVFGEGYENVVKTQNYNTELTAPTVPERVGYTFAGWNPEVNTTVPAENKTFTAQWNLNKYKVTFKDYDGSILLAEAEYDYDSDLSGVVPNMTGRTNNDGAPFGGWDNDYTGKVPAFDVVYTAVYGGTYILQFVVDGEIIQSGEVDYNTTITAPESPTKEEHTFMGWKDQYDKYFNEYNGKMPAKNVTFTAQWKANQYTVTFVLNNGSTDIVYTQDYGSPIVAPEDPVKKGYTFTGWTPEVASVVPGHNLTYEATYQVNTYNVIYMVYGEEWARDQYTYDSPIVIRQYSGTILDDFRGWQSDAEYSTMPDHDVTYVADITRLDPIAITSAMIQDIADTTYVGNAIEPAIVVKYGELTLVEGTDYSVNYADNINAGTAKVTVTAIQGSCFSGSADKMFTILKADVIIRKAPVGLNLVYTGQPLALVDAGIVEGGTILYSEDGETYSENIPTGTEVQDYTVYYKIIGDANHNDKGAQILNASIFRGFPVVVAAGEYVTFYCDRALKLDVAETDAILYTVTDVNGSVATVGELTVAAPNTPLLVYNKGVETKTFILVPTDDAPENIAVYSGFKGTLEDQQMDGSSDTKDYYVMSGQYFMLVRDAGTIAANRCWIEINKSVSLSAPRLIIGVGGDTTGINGIINTADDNEAWYDLNGRKLASKPTKKGLYIKNGKKVVIK